MDQTEPVSSTSTIPSTFRPYKGWVLLALVSLWTFAFLLIIIAISIEANAVSRFTTEEFVPMTQQLGVLHTIAVILLTFTSFAVLVYDPKNMFGLYGLIQWKKFNWFVKIVVGYFAILLIVFLAPYFYLAIKYTLQSKQITVADWIGKHWSNYRARQKQQKIVFAITAVLIFLLVSSFVVFAAYIDNSNAVTRVTKSIDATATTVAYDRSISIEQQTTATAETQVAATTVAQENSTAAIALTPTPAPQWTVVHTFTGNGKMQTERFTVPQEWKLSWTCNPASDYFGSYNVIIHSVYSAGGKDLLINTICETQNTSGETHIYQDGEIYLDLTISGEWLVEVQILR